MRKGENAGNQHFHLFPTMFSTNPKKYISPLDAFILLSANALSLNQSKDLLFGKELTLYHTMATFDVLEEKAF